MSLSILATPASSATPAAGARATETAESCATPFAETLQRQQVGDAANDEASALAEAEIEAGEDGDAGAETSADELAVDADLALVLIAALPVVQTELADTATAEAAPVVDPGVLLAAGATANAGKELPTGPVAGMAMPVIAGNPSLPVDGKALPTAAAKPIGIAGDNLGRDPLKQSADTAPAVLAAAPSAPTSETAELATTTAAIASETQPGGFRQLMQADSVFAGLAVASRIAGAGSIRTQDLERSGLSETPIVSSLTGTSPVAGTSPAEPATGLPVRSPAFGTLLANQVLWQAKVGNNEAAIRLDPPELGPIDVRISQVDNETHLHFVVGHSLTRDQLEQAVPRLRELFSAGGLALGQVQVEQGNRDQASGRQGGEADRTPAGQLPASGQESAPILARALNGLIDDYA